MMVKTRCSFARMSRKSLIVSISSLYSLTIFSRSSPGQLIQAQIEDLVRLMFAEGVAAIGQPRFVANENADLFDLPFGEIRMRAISPALLRDWPIRE
jgi:hypothetical protein